MKHKAQINAVFGADIKEFSTAMQNVQRQMKTMGTKMKSIGKSMSTFVTLPLAGLGAASIKMASDFEESMNKVDVAFGKSAESVKEFASTTLRSYGIAEGSALDMAALFGDMATSMGLSQESAAGMSTSLVALAGDLASFKNIGIKEAQTALAGIFTGETESLKRLGVVMTQANLQAFAYTHGITKKVQAMTEAEKVNLRYNYIIAKTTNAHGDFARTGGGAANQMRIFQETLKELSANFGQIILPVFTKVIKKVNGLLQRFGDMDQSTKKIIVVVAALAAAIGPVLYALGSLNVMMSKIAAKNIIVMSQFLLIVAALAALGLAVKYVSENWDALTERFSDINWWKDLLIDMAQLFIDYNPFTGLIEGYNAMVEKFGGEGINNPFLKWRKDLEDLRSENLNYNTELKSMGSILGDIGAKAKKAGKELKKIIFGDLEGTGETEGPARSKRSYTPIKVEPKAAQDVIEVADAIDRATKAMGEMSDAQEVQMQQTREWGSTFVNVTKAIRATVEQALADTITYFAEQIGRTLADSSLGFDNFGKKALESIAAFAQQLGQIMIGLGTAQIALKTLALAPGAAIAAGAALVAGAAYARQMIKEDMPEVALANGGLVYGPTLSLVGDNPGAQYDPEVVAPLSKLSKMMGGGTVVMETRLKGDDIYLQQKRRTQYNNRVR
jgi:hypothetical protein